MFISMLAVGHPCSTLPALCSGDHEVLGSNLGKASVRPLNDISTPPYSLSKLPLYRTLVPVLSTIPTFGHNSVVSCIGGEWYSCLFLTQLRAFSLSKLFLRASPLPLLIASNQLIYIQAFCDLSIYSSRIVFIHQGLHTL